MFITYTLEPVETDTKMTCEVESDKYGYLWILLKFFEILFLRRLTEKQWQKALENLKTILEK